MKAKGFVSSSTDVRSMFPWAVCIILVLGTSMAFPSLAQGCDEAGKAMVKGSFTHGNTRVTFTDAVAYGITPKGAVEGEKWRVVHLSDKPFDRARLREELTKDGWYSKAPDNQLKLTFDPKGEVYYLFFYLREGNVSYNTAPFGVKGHAVFSRERAKGRVFMQKPKKAMDENYQFDVTFETDIIPN